MLLAYLPLLVLQVERVVHVLQLAQQAQVQLGMHDLLMAVLMACRVVLVFLDVRVVQVWLVALEQRQARQASLPAVLAFLAEWSQMMMVQVEVALVPHQAERVLAEVSMGM